MKPFTFTLDHLRDYKNQVLDTEKNLLMTQYKKLYDIEDKIDLSRNFRHEKMEEMQIMQQQGATMRDLEECKFYLENTRIRLEELEEERAQAAVEVERQRNVVIKASQDVTSLDKLEERQLEDYHFLEARDNEKVLMEQVIHSLVYSKSASH
ncbi:MAG: flagellar FliJ family protein [Peptococcaceae bacterium]|jgi:flagellar FliJ protein|nr:flagellar FliJ family protein [Peptococcaceae bacterium]